VSFAAITLCVASERVFIVVSGHFVIDSVRKLLDTYSDIQRNVRIKEFVRVSRFISEIYEQSTKSNNLSILVSDPAGSRDHLVR
jgi:hypothetical protein